jgi:hypothetical protein
MPKTQNSHFVRTPAVDATHNHAVGANPSNRVYEMLESSTEPESDDSDPMPAHIVIVGSSDDKPFIQNQLGLYDYPNCDESTAEEIGKHYIHGRQ